MVKGDIQFDTFLNDTPAWNIFYQKINSAEFVKYYLDLFTAAHLGGAQLDFSGRFIDSYTKRSLAARVCDRLGVNNFYKVYLNLMSYIRKHPLYIDFSVYQTKGGYIKEGHTDDRHKLVLILLYFNSKEDLEGKGELEIYEHVNANKNIEDFERFPESNNVKKIKSLVPDDNVGAILLNTNCSYHGVSNFNAKVPRNTCYISVCAKKQIWEGQKSQLF